MEAGGFTPEADLRKVSLIRIVKGEHKSQVVDLRAVIKGKPLPAIYCNGGDVIYVPEKLLLFWPLQQNHNNIPIAMFNRNTTIHFYLCNVFITTVKKNTSINPKFIYSKCNVTVLKNVAINNLLQHFLKTVLHIYMLQRFENYYNRYMLQRFENCYNRYIL